MLTLLALAVAAPLDKDFHAGLHQCEVDTGRPPPPVLWDEDDQAKLKAGESVFHFVHLKGHDLAVAAVTTWADKWEVWSAITDVEDYPESLTGVAWAKIDGKSAGEGFQKYDVSMELEVPVPMVPGGTRIEAFHYRDAQYLVFRQVEAAKKEKRALSHALGYWSVTDMGDGKSLVVAMIDVLPDFPFPVPLREEIATTTMPLLVWNIARTAEASVNNRNVFMNETEQAPEPAPAP